MIRLGNFAVSSSDHLGANHNKISPVDLVMDNFVPKYSCTYKYTPVPAGNHRPTCLRYTVKHRPPIIIQICSSRCVIVSQPLKWLRLYMMYNCCPQRTTNIHDGHTLRTFKTTSEIILIFLRRRFALF